MQPTKNYPDRLFNKTSIPPPTRNQNKLKSHQIYLSIEPQNGKKILANILFLRLSTRILRNERNGCTCMYRLAFQSKPAQPINNQQSKRQFLKRAARRQEHQQRQKNAATGSGREKRKARKKHQIAITRDVQTTETLLKRDEEKKR